MHGLSKEILVVNKSVLVALAFTLCAGGAIAAVPAANHAATASAVQAGAYKADPNHTQVIWSVDHMGLSKLYGMMGQVTGTLQLDPAKPAAAVVDIEIPVSAITVTSAPFSNHLKTADLFDMAKYPTAKFVSKSVTVKGQSATIVGDLTLHGVTKPVTLAATFHGAGPNAQSKVLTVGFSAKTQIKRSEFGMNFAVPVVSDLVDLEITAAFEKS